MPIITCNSGSSNTKLALFDGTNLNKIEDLQTHSKAETIDWLRSLNKKDITAIGHRVVHGGDKFTSPVIITPQIIKELEEFIPLAPLHQPAALELIAEAMKLYPDIPHIACFDTSFHHTLPEIERMFALPKKYYDSGIKRYGFHGLSYEYIASVLPENLGEKANGKIIVAHLGGGASACALKNLQSIATSMGFSTLDGLMMGTRPGALDAGVIMHLIEHKKMTLDEINHLLYKESGLLGISGASSDMRELLASDEQAAHNAIELYCYIAAKQIAALLPAIGGLDALVFTGGIGEHAKPVREKICAHLKWLGDFAVYAIATDEEIVIAKACERLSKN